MPLKKQKKGAVHDGYSVSQPLRQKDCTRKQGVFPFKSSIPQERLPMLDVVFDRFVHGLAGRLRHLTSDNVEIVLKSISCVRFSDYLGSLPERPLIGILRAEEWDSRGLVTVNPSLVYSVVDVFLGGRSPGSKSHAEGRPYTTIERNLVERLLSTALQELSLAFAPLTSVNFIVDGIEIHPKFTGIVRSISPCFLIVLQVCIEGREGELQFLFPQATLDPIRHLLSEMLLGEKFGRDMVWEEHVTSELSAVDLTLEAVLDQQVFGLGNVLDWEQGSIIPLGVGRECVVTLQCLKHPIFSGKMGYRRGKLAISIEENFPGDAKQRVALEGQRSGTTSKKSHK